MSKTVLENCKNCLLLSWGLLIAPAWGKYNPLNRFIGLSCKTPSLLIKWDFFLRKQRHKRNWVDSPPETENKHKQGMRYPPPPKKNAYVIHERRSTQIRVVLHIRFKAMLLKCNIQSPALTIQPIQAYTLGNIVHWPKLILHTKS